MSKQAIAVGVGRDPMERNLRKLAVMAMEHFEKAQGSMSAEAKRAVALISQDINMEDLVSWEKLGADSFKGFEDDDVEDDPSVPGVPAFEVKPSPGRGLGLFATRNIKKGTEIFREAALIEGVDGAQTWLHLEAFFQALSEEKKAQLHALDNACACKEVPCIDAPLMKAWSPNSFRKIHGEKTGEYLYNYASRINHDCRPSSHFMFTKEGHIVFYASRGIRKGEEITQDYRGRRLALMDKYGFTCQCSACVDNVVLPVEHLFNTLRVYEGAQAEGKGTEVIGLHSAEETKRMAEALAWVQTCHMQLEEAADMMKKTLFLYAVEQKYAPGPDSELKDIFASRMKADLKKGNFLGISEKILDGFVDTLIRRVLAIVEEKYKEFSNL